MSSDTHKTIIMVSLIAAVVGLFLPWASVFGTQLNLVYNTVFGESQFGDGIFALIPLAIGLFMVSKKFDEKNTLLGGMIGMGLLVLFGFWKLYQLNDAMSYSFGLANIGIGAWLFTLACVVGTIFCFMAWRQDEGYGGELN